MAVVNTLSATITARDASPQIPVDLRLGGRSFTKREVITIANGDSTTSKYRFFPLPSNAVVESVKVSAPDIGTTTAGDFGLYDTTQNGSAVVSATFFQAAVVLNAGAITKSEIVFGNVITVANSKQRIWQQLGLASDPGKDYDVCMNLSGAADAAGAVLLEIQYKMV